MIKSVNVQALRKVDVIVGNSHVGSIDVTKKGQSSSTQSSKPSLSPTMSFLMAFDDEDLEESFNSQHKKGQGNYRDDEFQDQLNGWTANDDETLRAAVNTLGLNCWGRISKHWFHGKKIDFECQHRWETLSNGKNHYEENKNDKSSFTSSLSSTNQSSCTSTNTSSTSFIQNRYDDGKRKCIKPSVEPPKTMKSIPLRKRRELEAMEERRLFGKDRSDAEKDLIHRAYIVGQNKMEQIMRMNAAETKGEYETTISFSSVVTEMKNVKSSDVEDSLKANSKRKLPRSVMEIEEKKLLSPMSDAVVVGNAHQKTKKDPSPHEDLLNLQSSQLPIQQIIDVERQRIVEADCKKRDREGSIYDAHSRDGDDDDDDVSFTEFLSPPLKRPFPCLGIPKPVYSSYTPPKPYFMF